MERLSSRFNNDTSPNLYNSIPTGAAYRAGHKEVISDAFSTRDVRYPAYVAAIEDGRMVTDYRPKCSKNVKTGYQFDTKLWMIRNADQIMDETRKKQMEWSGAGLPMANTAPPPAAIVHSTPFYSELEPTYLHNGLGTERADSKAPDLFGTFWYAPSMTAKQMNRKNIAVTSMYEGGRNTPRGAF